ncbi:hypothetical protein [Vibrio parahaemolyticus]|uniref:hypothetical protein n=1 Tax=Vibrio parahaemolyticus TaxID=670 RepID=UPI003AABA031
MDIILKLPDQDILITSNHLPLKGEEIIFDGESYRAEKTIYKVENQTMTPVVHCIKKGAGFKLNRVS